MSNCNGCNALGEGPCCVEVYKIKEYAAAIKVIIANGIKLVIAKNIFEEINKISLAKLIEGGAAILHAVKENHQKVNEGNKFKSPAVT